MNAMNAINTSPAAAYIKTPSDALIVFSFSFHAWGATKTDRKITEEVTKDNDAVKEAGRFSKNLLGKNPQMAAIKSNRDEFRNYCDAKLQPHGRGAYVMRWTKYADFKRDVINPFLAKDRELVSDFISVYPNLISAAAFAKAGLGNMFNRNDYPPVEEIQDKFEVRLMTAPLPTDDLFSQIASEQGMLLRETFNTEMDRRITEAMQFAWDKLYKSLDWAAKACEEREVGEDGKLKRKPIHESSIQRLLELSETLKDFNITNDLRMEAARVALEGALQGKTVKSLSESLKASPESREEIKAKIESVRNMLDF